VLGASRRKRGQLMRPEYSSTNSGKLCFIVIRGPNEIGGAAPSGLDGRQKAWYERSEIGEAVCPRLKQDGSE
jgi:hypothetical protein